MSATIHTVLTSAPTTIPTAGSVNVTLGPPTIIAPYVWTSDGWTVVSASSSVRVIGLTCRDEETD